MGDSEKSDLPVGWVTATIAELGSIFSGGTPSTKEPEYWGDEISWISPSDLSGYSGKFISQGAKSLTKKGLENSSAKVMPAGSVHFSSRAPIGYVVISSEEMTTNQGFKSLVPATGIFNEYVYYYLKSAKKTAEDMASGTTFKEISGSAFARLPVPLPPLPEQKRIVAKIEELFSELDKGIESFKTAREQLKVYRQALLKHAFEGKLTEKWRTENVGAIPTGRPGVDCTDEHGRAAEKGRAVGIAPTKRRKPLPPLTAEELAELPELPDGWGWVKLGNHAFVTKLAGFEFTKYVKYKDNGDIPVIRAQNVSKEGFVSKNFLYVDRAIMEQLPRSRVYGGGSTDGIRWRRVRPSWNSA